MPQRSSSRRKAKHRERSSGQSPSPRKPSPAYQKPPAGHSQEQSRMKCRSKMCGRGLLMQPPSMSRESSLSCPVMSLPVCGPEPFSLHLLLTSNLPSMQPRTPSPTTPTYHSGGKVERSQTSESYVKRDKPLPMC